jgi:acyl dehydratase
MQSSELVGRDLGAVSFPVDRSKVAELARAFGDEDPAWFDTEAAAAAGFDGEPTQPTITVLGDHWREGGALAHAEALQLDLARLLHGEASWEYLLPVRVGDRLTARSEVTGTSTREGKRGGKMTFFTIETTYENQRGELAVRRKDTLIERGESA